MADVSRFAAVCAASDVVSSPELTALFLDRAEIDDLLCRRVATQPRLPDVEKLVTKHGYRLAARFARAASADPQVLAVLAKHASVQVLREVAANKNTDQATVEALWQTALRSADSELLLLLIPRADPRTVTDVFDVPGLERDRLFPTYFAKMSATAEPPWYDQGSRFVVGSKAFRVLREASDELRAEAVPPLLASVHVRAALEAAAMCAAGAVPGVSAVEAFERFVDTHPGVLEDLKGDDRFVSADTACLRHMALSPDVTIDAGLAELLCANADYLVCTAPFTSQNYHTTPLFGDRVTSEAFEVFRRRDIERAEFTPEPTTIRALIQSSWLSLSAAELGRELEETRCAASVCRVLEAAPDRLSSSVLNQALRFCIKHNTVPDILSRVSAVTVDEDLLVKLLRIEPSSTLVSFLTGEMSATPTPGVVAQLFADNTDRLYRNAIAARFPDWKDQPWADALIEALGPVMFGLDGRAGDAVIGMFLDAFGTDPEQWAFAFDLLSQGFPGSLLELLDMVKSLVPTSPLPEPAS